MQQSFLDMGGRGDPGADREFVPRRGCGVPPQALGLALAKAGEVRPAVRWRGGEPSHPQRPRTNRGRLLCRPVPPGVRVGVSGSVWRLAPGVSGAERRTEECRRVT